MLRDAESTKKEVDPDDPSSIIKAAVVDDEYGKGKAGSESTYYTIAHSLREPISEQPKMLAFGQLKEYQVFFGRILYFVYKSVPCSIIHCL